MNDITDSPCQIQFDDDGATVHGMTKEFHRTNSSHAQVCNPLLDLSSSIHLYSTPCADLMTSFRITDSATRPRSSVMDSNMSLDIESASSFLTLSIGETDPGSVQVSNMRKLHVRRPHICRIYPLVPCLYDLHVLKDMVVADENDCFSPPDNQRWISGSPCCSTPYICTKSISANISSPESILRIAATSYKSTPSIIRKRSFRKAAVLAQPSCSCKPTDENSCTNDMEVVDRADSVNVHLSLLSLLEFSQLTSTSATVNKAICKFTVDFTEKSCCLLVE
ncbi:hypothetical protein RJ641_001220 [Dillenia turbinata]|uniref:Uncharacterized protein n=1 Tax=Dillenia turbinata TaxID=194707 RepID=A0AAN8ZS81_9MAGN